MVKVQKPGPKSLNKDVSAKAKNIPMKNSKAIVKTVQKFGKKEVKEIIAKVSDVNAKSKKTQQKDKKSVQKKKTVEKVESNSLPLERKEQQKSPKVFDVNTKSKKTQQKDQKCVQKKKPVEKVENMSQPLESKEQQKSSKVSEVNTKSKKTQKDQKSVQKKKPVEKVENKSQPLESKEQKSQKKNTTVEKVDKKQLVVKKEVPQKEKKPAQKNSPTVEKVQNKKKGKQNFKEESDKTPNTPLFEPTNFDEDQFKDIVCLENLKKISKALKTQVEKEVSEKKTSIFSDYKYFLNVASYKIPNCPKRMVKLNVKHSLVDPNTDDVVLIVPDLQRGAKVDHEPTIQHYEDLLRENGVNNIKIVPFNQLRNEYTTFEAKRKLANTYDYFLCDGRIVGHAASFCGKPFQKPRATLHAVRLNNPKTYKSDIEHALKRTSYKQLRKGDLISIPVGSDRFTTDQVAENVEVVIDQLKTLFPGGYANIRKVYLKIDIRGTPALPVYINLAGAPAETPNVIGPREQRMLKLKKQANDILSKFSMSKTGEFVKLNKTQVKRKQQIREARTALLSKDDNDSEFNPPSVKKAKKNEPVEEVEDSDGEDEEGDSEEEEDAEEEDSDAEEEDCDAEEEDNDKE